MTDVILKNIKRMTCHTMDILFIFVNLDCKLDRGNYMKTNKRIFFIQLLTILTSVFFMVSCTSSSESAQQQTLQDPNQMESSQSEASIFEEQLIGAIGFVNTLENEVLVWEIYGEVAEISVSVGDFVAQGDLLLSLDKESVNFDEAENDDQVSLIDLQIIYLQTIEEQNQLYKGYSSYTIAQKELENAQQMSVVSIADYAVWRVYNYPTQTKIDEATARYVIAQQDLADAERRYQTFLNTETLPKFRTEEGQRQWRKMKLAQDVKLYTAQLEYYNDYNAYLDVVNGYSDVEIAILEADAKLQKEILAILEEELIILKAGPIEDEVFAMEQALIEAEENINVTELYAPFDGRITELYLKVGDTVSINTNALRIDSWNKQVIEASVLEIDIALIQLGDLVDIYFDSMPGEVFEGRVIEISTVGKTIKSITEFPITIEIIDSIEQILPGMTAIVDIHIEN